MQYGADNAHVLTYTAAGSAVVFWGLNLNDIGVLISMTCAILGVLIQCFAVLYKLRQVENRQTATEGVAIATAVSNRAVATQAAVADAKADVAIALATPAKPLAEPSEPR